MKIINRILIILALLSFSKVGFAQLRGINYQAVAIDENGKEIAGMNLNGQADNNKTISIRFSILSSSTTGAILYQETHTTNTDQYGLFSLIIGDGSVTSLGQYQLLIDIPWSAANQFLKVEIATKNNGDYKIMSIQQFMTVPYAFYALKSDTASYALDGNYENIDSLIANYISIDSLFANYTNIDSLFVNYINVDSLFANYVNIDSLFANYINVDSLFANYANINSLLANYINVDSIFANYANMDSLFANYINVDSLFANYVNIDSLFANYINVDSMFANYANIDSLFANYINVDSIFANYANFDSLFANYINVDSLFANYANIDSLFSNYINLDSLFANYTNIDSLFANYINVDSIFANYANIDSLFANYINVDSIFANYANFDSLFANYINVDSLFANYANIDSLFSNYINLDSLFANYANMDSLFADYINVDSLFANYANIDSLFADYINVDSLFANYANFDSLLANYINVDSIFANYANIDSLFANYINLDSLFANYANMDSLFANYINVDSLFANYANMDSLFINYINVDSLFANYANIDSLFANYINVDSLFASYANIDSLFVNYINADSLFANYAKIDSLFANYINVDSILANYANIDSLIANYINADSLIANYANIDSLIVNYINVDSIYANFANIDSLISNYINADSIFANYANFDSLVVNGVSIQNLICGAALTNYVTKFTSSASMCNSIIYDDGTNVGIGTTTPGAKLEVAGQVKITGGTPGLGKVLTSDAVGLSIWAAPNLGTLTSITAGTGLTGGVITTSGTIALAIPVSIANGGTNNTSIGSAGAVTYSNGTQHTSTAVGTAGQVLTSAGAGTPTWTTPTVGTVTNVTATLPVLSSGGITPDISITQSGTASNGFLSSIDWNTFNTKVGGSGTLNYLPKWTPNGGTLGNSLIFDNGANVGIATASPDPSAKVDITSTNNGLLVPRMTTAQRNSIASPSHSLLIFNTTTDCFESWNQNTLTWVPFGCIGCQLPGAFSAAASSAITAISFSANWTTSAGATTYYLDVSTVNNFSSFVAGYNNLNVGNVVSSNVTGLICGTYYYRLRANNTCGTSPNSGVVTEISNPAAVPAQPSVITGTTPVCQNTLGIAYSVTNVAGLTYAWTYSGVGFSCASGCATNSITANFSGAATSGTLTVTPSNACGNGIVQTLAVTITPTTTTSAANSDQAICATTATLAGNIPASGTGLWTLIGGTGTITTPSSASSGLTALGLGANTFRWTISNAPCASSTDDVIITRSDVPTVSAASIDQTICATSATLAGNTPTVGTGLWTLISGAGTITTPSSPTSGLTALGVGANTFRWTISNAPCTASMDDVIITRSAVPTVSAANTDQAICATTATLAGNAPGVGTGLWTLISGVGTITTPSSPTSGLTALGVGANTFRWTISNAPCTASTDDVIITRSDVPTVATAGIDQAICATTATLAGNAPAVGTGLWTLISGAGTITAPTSPTSGLTALGVGANTFRWTISNAPCTATTDDIIITRSDVPTIATAGADQYSACSTTATLAGNAPTVGTGVWSVISGTATITTPSSPTSGVTGLTIPGTATLRWTISNTPCAASIDDVVLTNPTFSCGSPFIDCRDGKSYNTTLIGTQCWMAQNLDYSTSGTYITGVTEQTNNGIVEKYCHLDNDAECTIYGGLYEWAEMVQYTNGGTNTTSWSPVPAGNVQGICPIGWHVPTDIEWCTMENTVEPGTDPGCNGAAWRGTNTAGMLKQTGTTLWYAPNTGATNSTGFSALPAEYRQSNGAFSPAGAWGYYWTRSETNATNVVHRRFFYAMGAVFRSDMPKTYGHAVRCVKD